MPKHENKRQLQNELSPKQRDELLAALQARLEARPDKLWSLAEMERTGGEPDVFAHDKNPAEFVFFDCSEQSPAGKGSVRSIYTIRAVR